MEFLLSYWFLWLSLFVTGLLLFILATYLALVFTGGYSGISAGAPIRALGMSSLGMIGIGVIPLIAIGLHFLIRFLN